MAEERNLGQARARETVGDEASKEALQRRMDEARDSISNTVTEIKETVVQQYENVKDALDWREHFKKQPVAWSLGAAGVGFFVGYGIAAAFTGDEYDEDDYATSTSYSRSSPSYVRQSAYTPRPLVEESSTSATKTNGNEGIEGGPGIFKRLQNTPVYDRLSKEAGTIGDRLVEELSSTAQEVVLPALLKKIKSWIGADLSDKAPSMSAKPQGGTTSYEPSLGRVSEY